MFYFILIMIMFYFLTGLGLYKLNLNNTIWKKFYLF